MCSGPRVAFNGLNSCIRAGSLGVQLARRINSESRRNYGDRLFFEHGTTSTQTLRREFWLCALRYRGEL